MHATDPIRRREVKETVLVSIGHRRSEWQQLAEFILMHDYCLGRRCTVTHMNFCCLAISAQKRSVGPIPDVDRRLNERPVWGSGEDDPNVWIWVVTAPARRWQGSIRVGSSRFNFE